MNQTCHEIAHSSEGYKWGWSATIHPQLSLVVSPLGSPPNRHKTFLSINLFLISVLCRPIFPLVPPQATPFALLPISLKGGSAKVAAFES